MQIFVYLLNEFVNEMATMIGNLILQILNNKKAINYKNFARNLHNTVFAEVEIFQNMVAALIAFFYNIKNVLL